MTDIKWLRTNSPFPSPRDFVQDDSELPEGLIAISDSINENRLIAAYRLGIFPWYSKGQPVLWWCTSPRMVLKTSHIKISKSLHKKIQQVQTNPEWEIKIDTAFQTVMESCANTQRKDQDDTWITAEIIDSYVQLHHLGIAHSVETWYQNELVGGLYGINLGKMMYGESMFTKVTDASKIALTALCAWCTSVGIELIDCQQETHHLGSLGAKPIPKTEFLDWIESQIDLPAPSWNWNKSVLCAYNKVK
jgi:leucyl/phenylalanyl-tRNA--protein transferase